MNIGRPAPDPINTASNPSFIHQFIYSSGFTDDNVGVDLNTERFYIFNFCFVQLYLLADGIPEYHKPEHHQPDAVLQR